MSGYASVLEALETRDLLKGGWGDAKSALCPAHDDSTASLSLREGDDGRALLYCHAGCDTKDVVEALDLTLADLFLAKNGGAVSQIYVYRDEEGNPLTRVLRLSPKGFTQERWEDGEWKPGLRDTRRVLYNLPKLREWIARGWVIHIVEGEKDAESMMRAGACVTTALGGAGNWREEYNDSLAGARTIIVADNDEVGRAHAAKVRLSLLPVAASTEIVVARAGKDATDHLEAGYQLNEFLPLDTGGLEAFAPLDWNEYEHKDTAWLFRPYVPRGGRVLAFGSAGSLKSLWAMWLAAKLSHEGRKVAYFSLEMRVSDAAKRVKSLAPDPANFKLFTRFKLVNEEHQMLMIDQLKGYDLIVIDSWSSAHQFGRGLEQNDEVARIDNEVFQPIIDNTGATLLILDNTGNEMLTESGKRKPEHARGASAKGDKMEVTLWFDRPEEANNYRTRIVCKKMRLDEPTPRPVTVETPQDRIEFYIIEGGKMSKSMWPSATSPTDGPITATASEEDDAAAPAEPQEELSDAEARALARLRDKFKSVDAMKEAAS